MLSFIFWVSLSATTLLMLAVAVDEIVRLARRRVPQASAEGAASLVAVSLVHARALRVIPVTRSDARDVVSDEAA